MNFHTILDGLNPEQEQAVKHFEGPLLILAGAGSGKTRVLTHRVAYLMSEYGVNPWNILALTFTNKAAGEMRERVDQMVGEEIAKDIWVSTFHSTCVRILRRYIDALGYQRSFTIYDADDQKSLMREILKFLQLDPKKYKERSVLRVISSAKDELMTPEEFEIHAQGDYFQEVCARCYKEYEKRLHDSNALDFDDLIVKTIELFHEQEDILSYYQNRFRYIMVDEYQDTNTAQFQLIRLLASTTGINGEPVHNLCVVGDDDQSIYKFRGANIHNILSFESQYPEAKVIKLEENYRSTQNILDAANAVIQNNLIRKQKALWTKKGKGELIHFHQFQNEYEEADRIIGEIAQAVVKDHATYNDFAILYRTNAQSRVFEEKLIERNIPYRIVGAVNFYQRKEIKDLLAYLRTIDNGADDLSLKRILNVPKRGIGLTTMDRITQYAQIHEISFYAALQNCEYIDGISRSAAKIGSFVSLIESLKHFVTNPSHRLEDLIRKILEDTGYLALLKEEDTEDAKNRIENIEEFINKAAAYEANATEPTTLSEFLEEIALVADIDTVEEEKNLVLLMTLHSAKGLEFPCVYLTGMEDGIFPSYLSISGGNPEELEEERRLCYVGITRAKEHLTLSCARYRFRNGEQQCYHPSSFIEEIPHFLLIQDKEKPQPSSHPSRMPDTSNGFSIKKQSSKWTPEKNNHPLISKGMKPTKSRVEIQAFQPGDMVSHFRFGKGIIKEAVPKKEDSMLTIEFENGMTSKMMASFAKLKKL